MKTELESRFSQLEQDANYPIATFLVDTSFKTSYLGAFEAKRAQKKILVEYIKVACEESSNSGSSSPTATKRIRDDKTVSTLAFTSEAHDTFWDGFDEVPNETLNKCQECY